MEDSILVLEELAGKRSQDARVGLQVTERTHQPPQQHGSPSSALPGLTEIQLPDTSGSELK
jgi:hypothetical protein